MAVSSLAMPLSLAIAETLSCLCSYTATGVTYISNQKMGSARVQMASEILNLESLVQNLGLRLDRVQLYDTELCH